MANMDEGENVTGGRKRLRKAKAPRSRLGCGICRSRHVKCDETKPYCRNCKVNGRECDGYTPRRKEKTPVLALDLSASLNVAAILPSADQERVHFHFFQQQTAPELSGYFDAEFYNELMLQMSREEPSIRHAVIALGALHRSVKAEDGVSVQLKSLSLLHYTKAIGRLAENVGGKVDITLICCLLFVWMETLHGNHVGRMEQLTSGLKILREWQQKNVDSPDFSSTVSDSFFIKKHLAPLFTRLDLQGVSFEHGRNPLLELHLRLDDAARPSMPAKFSSIEEARDWLDIVLYWLHNSVHSKRTLEPLPERLHGRRYLEQWDISMSSFLNARSSSISDAYKRACTILCIYQKMSFVMLASRVSITESNYTPFDPQFKSITAMAESLFNASGGTGALDGFQFPFQMGVVAPLFYVSSKCQNLGIRARALSLLMQCPQKKGIWDGLGVAKMTSMSLESANVDWEHETDGGNKWADRYEAAADTSPIARLESVN